MDFAFAPGVSSYDSLARQLFTNRPNTQLVRQRGLNTVDAFLSFLNTSPTVTLPADDLYLVSHGNDKAWMQIHLDTTQSGGTTFEVAKAAVATGSVNLPTNVNHGSSGALNSMSVNIRGCRIGAANPFVDQLKEAFGGDSPVTAALHFHEVYRMTGVGMLEFLVYGFTLVSQTAFVDQAATKAAFDAEGFTYRDGSGVPTALWDDWVPRRVSVGHRDSSSVYLQLGPGLGTQTRIPSAIGFRHDQPRFTYKISGLSSMPTAHAAQLDTLRQALNADAATTGSTFASAHPFPMFTRYTQNSIDDFVDNMNWSCSWDRPSSLMICVGSQHEYTVLVPVTDPPDLATGKLIYNFYPPSSSALTAVEELLTSDATMFYTA
ncbi:hypothetical protein [Lapillicoccus sp.]|uniref:hypothetical protein n=1 Tax=Lapillicoccus sp. TaxID=1909287 RepID=UPI0032661EE2